MRRAPTVVAGDCRSPRRLAAVAFTLVVSALLVAWAGAPVRRAYRLLLEGGFGSVFALERDADAGDAAGPDRPRRDRRVRARLFNIGAEGQLYAGALAAIAVGGLHGGSGFARSPWLLFPLMMAAAALAGALLLLGPALLKLRLGVDEVVTTLLLNFIVLLGVGALLDGPMKDPTAMGWPQSVALQAELEIGKLIPQTRVHTRPRLGDRAGAALLWALIEVHGVRLRDARARRERARRRIRRHAGDAHDGRGRAAVGRARRARRRDRGRRPHRLRHARHVARATATAAS